MPVVVNKLQQFPLFHLGFSQGMPQFIVNNLTVNSFELFFSFLLEMCLQSSFTSKNSQQEPVLTTYIQMMSNNKADSQQTEGNSSVNLCNE